MLWHASITPQRPAPHGEAVMTGAGQPSFLDRSITNPEHHAEINPQHTVLRGSAGCAVMANPWFSEDRLSKPVPGRRL